MNSHTASGNRSHDTGYSWFLRMYWRAGWMLVRALSAAYRIRLSGWEHVPERGSFLIVANHQSHLDPPLIGLLPGYRRPFGSVARSGLFAFKPLGWLMRAFGAVPIVQGAGDMAAIKIVLNELARGRPVMIFPEGSRSHDGRMGEFQRGITLILKRSGVPLLPMAIEGAFEVWPRSHMLPRLRGRVAVCAAPLIEADELLKHGPDVAMRDLERQIDAMRLKLRAELRRSTNDRIPPPGPADQVSFPSDRSEANT